MDPVRFLFSVTCNVYNPILAIIISTVSIKICCMPIEILYHKNKIKYLKVKEFTKGIKERKIRKKKEKKLLYFINASKKEELFFLHMVKGLLLILLVNAIKETENTKILWFYISEIDKSNRLPMIYAVILVFTELIECEKTTSFIGRGGQIIMSLGIAVLMYSVSRGSSSGTIIYWIVYSVSQMVLRHFYFNGYLKRQMEKKYNTKYFNQIERMIEQEGGLSC